MRPAGPTVPLRDPRVLAPVDAYMTDEKRLVRILEVDHSGAIGEDVVSDALVEISPIELLQRWRRVRPAA